jgi:hypothetical protein
MRRQDFCREKLAVVADFTFPSTASFLSAKLEFLKIFSLLLNLIVHTYFFLASRALFSLILQIQ